MSEDTPAPVRVAFQIQKFVDAAQLKADLSINPSDVSNAMIQHASLFIHYGTLLAKASKQFDDLKMILETAEARVDRRLRNEALAAKEKVTEGVISSRVASDPTIFQYRRLLNEARQVENLAKAAVDGFRQRKDMLVSYGMLQREELRGEVSINRRAAVEEEHSARLDRLKDRNAAASGT